ncbi:hypothetical protein SDC9_91554 [bioreactor metagenome]|uniref:Uncharacterized protein n=1 Tax=bioreactor metagenome TaxID=1076179 RepID=A0A644ZVL0_9ZZZZ
MISGVAVTFNAGVRVSSKVGSTVPTTYEPDELGYALPNKNPEPVFNNDVPKILVVLRTLNMATSASSNFL